MKHINVGVVGASGYTGIELIKILINHPIFNINYVATSTGDTELDILHPSLKDVFSCSVEKADTKEIEKRCELVFLALPHQASMGFAKDLINNGVKIVDLSADYRLELETYEKHYCPHEDKEHLSQAVYGLPELYREDIKKSSLVANPGCYPTASILGLIPFTKYIDENFPIFIDAKSGVSGAGKKCNESTHYISINENIFAYKVLNHRHEPEIKEKLFQQSSKDFDINFVPHLIPATRGELIDAYMLLNEDIDPIAVLKEFYKDEPFVRIFDKPVDIKSCSGTNFCDIYAQKKGNKLYVNSAVDNILRGSSSQAVANANLMCGLDEDLALPIIAYVP
ncbi:N-acetyl-gamma-glutamyl-phosphate reductase [Sulfurimonas lithotrophica]|uniref:N-acetyl-gamma-glutamyl-phosphate reductase n=1 Tax=Sulfurimonas lithotrophica TaxID=2590022 RepID=UPI00165F2725|nr:N-acetyl-gamma-glutamyl-phosphate reductase [Sulfurimonas lithotrophica]